MKRFFLFPLILAVLSIAPAQQVGGGGGVPGGASSAALPAATGAGQAPVSTGSGSTYTAQAIIRPSPSADQYVTQPLNNNSFTTMRVNSLNQVFYVDGFNGYGGIGVAPVAWSSAVNQPECQVVSYSGSYYLAVSATNNTTTPGTSYGVWYPVPNNAAATASDCAWAFAASYTRQFHQNSKVQWGSGSYTTNQSFVNPVDGNSYDDEFAVSGEGCGSGCTYITYTGPTAIPVFNRPTGGGNYASMRLANMEIDGGATASAAIEVSTLGQSYFENLSAGHIAPGSDHVVQLGRSGGDGFQIFASNINIGIYPDKTVVNCGVYTANLTGTTITSFTVNNGGSCYQTIAGELTVVQVKGNQNGTSAKPCGVMPTGMVATITGNAVTGISPPTAGGTNCSGTIDVQVYEVPNVAHGYMMLAGDSTSKDVSSYIGSVDGIEAIGDDVMIHMHPATIPVGIGAITGGKWYGTECDTISDSCFKIFSPFANSGMTINSTTNYIGQGGHLLIGQTIFEFENALAATSPISISTPVSLCESNPGGGTPADWNEFVTQSGTINSPADYLTKAPAGLTVLGNDTSCGQAMGDLVPTLTLSGAGTAAGFFPQSVSAGPYASYLDDFFTTNGITTTSIGSPSGQSCATSTTFLDNTSPGNISDISGTVSGAGEVCVGAGGAFQLFDAATAPSWTWEGRVIVPVLPGTTAGSYQAGMVHAYAASPWTTGIGFYLSSANSTVNDWYCRYGSTQTDSGVAATASSWTRLSLVDDGTYVHWYINGTEATACKTAIGSMPTTALATAFTSVAGSTTSVTMGIDYAAFHMNVTR